MRQLLFVFTAVMMSALAGSAFAQSASPIGKWLVENKKAQVEISQCGDKLCGKIVWLAEPNDAAGKPKVDEKNDDAKLRTRPILGLELLSGFVKDGSEWKNGQIYAADEGKTYSCIMSLDNPDTLKVRGYVGSPMFGKNQIWTRVTG